jgi:hypothetical protein
MPQPTSALPPLQTMMQQEPRQPTNPPTPQVPTANPTHKPTQTPIHIPTRAPTSLITVHKKTIPIAFTDHLGSNLIDYPYKLTTHMADTVSAKTMWNSIISTLGAKFGGADIKNMYLETPLDRYEYMKMPMSILPDYIIEHYDLKPKAFNDYVYMEIRRGMYGLPQAGILANKLLKEHLARHGYFEHTHTPGLWKYVSQPIWFNLCVDNFGIKYIGDKHLKQLFAPALWTETYDIVEDWKGDLYCGISLAWNFNKHYVDIATMPAYVAKQLLRYEYPHPTKPQHCPYNLNPIKYGQENQSVTPLEYTTNCWQFLVLCTRC